MKKLSVFFLIMIFLFGSSLSVHAAYADIEGNWARDAINRLSEQGVFANIYDDYFEPNNSITREQYIEIVARSFGLSDTDKQSLYSWLDHLMPMDSEQPDDTMLTRAELVAVVANVLGLTEQSINVNNWYPSFDDIDKGHPLFATIELINKLDILPTYVMNRFEPERISTRAEAAALIDAVLNLDFVDGQVVEIHHQSNTIILSTLDNQYRTLPIESGAIVIENGEKINLDQITTDDQLSALYDVNGSVAVVNIAGTTNTTNNNLLQGLSGIIQNFQNGDIESILNSDAMQTLLQIITPEQLVALISGNWSEVNSGFRDNLFGQLVEVGLSPWEVEALLAQDWSSLGDMGIDRAALIVSDYLEITPEIFYAAINQNWPQLFEYVQLELAQRLMSDISL